MTDSSLRVDFYPNSNNKSAVPRYVVRDAFNIFITDLANAPIVV